MDDEIQKDVNVKGWTALNVFDADPPSVYTVGLSTTFEHPEAIVFSLPSTTASRLLSDFVDGLRSGLRFDKPGVYTDDVFAGPVGVRVVDESHHEFYLGYAMGFCRNNRIDLTAVQLYWPDDEGKFPFETGCSEAVYDGQPRLDIPLTPSERKDFRWMDDFS